MRNFKGVNFAALLCSKKDVQELLSDLKVGELSDSGTPSFLICLFSFSFFLNFFPILGIEPRSRKVLHH